LSNPIVQAGYDYKAALTRLNTIYTYAEIAEYCGYESANSIYKILQGSIPSHPAGEAIYIMYLEHFKQKPL